MRGCKFLTYSQYASHGGYQHLPRTTDEDRHPQQLPVGNCTLTPFSNLVCHNPTTYHHAAPSPVSRHRAAIACKYCRKRNVETETRNLSASLADRLSLDPLFGLR